MEVVPDRDGDEVGVLQPVEAVGRADGEPGHRPVPTRTPRRRARSRRRRAAPPPCDRSRILRSDAQLEWMDVLQQDRGYILQHGTQCGSKAWGSDSLHTVRWPDRRPYSQREPESAGRPARGAAGGGASPKGSSRETIPLRMPNTTACVRSETPALVKARTGGSSPSSRRFRAPWRHCDWNSPGTEHQNLALTGRQEVECRAGRADPFGGGRPRGRPQVLYQLPLDFERVPGLAERLVHVGDRFDQGRHGSGRRAAELAALVITQLRNSPSAQHLTFYEFPPSTWMGRFVIPLTLGLPRMARALRRARGTVRVGQAGFRAWIATVLHRVYSCSASSPFSTPIPERR
ncbi:hypothetical protein SRIMM317S_01616 [Streptomyces rimosus subsp. rimosus]